jgi:lysyl-tRNA synthetase class 2
MEKESQLETVRKQKLNELREKGINPYAYSYEIKNHASEINEKYAKLKPEEQTKDKVSVAGRIMQLRSMGKIAFVHLQDMTGKVQLYFRENDLGKDKYKILKKIDIGDIIGAKGNVFKTKKGEVTVYVDGFELLTKSLLPLPEKWHGLKDPELRYRQRYVDLVMNPEVKSTFLVRDKIIEHIREYMKKEGYVEVATPILQSQYGGANARPFVSKLNALDMRVYMRISNEMYLKRLIVGGFEKIFEFSVDFRNEGIDRTHNPEFTLFEAMTAYSDYFGGMKLVEELTEYVVKNVTGGTKIKYQGKDIDFKAPWKRITVRDAIKKYAGIDIEAVSDDEIADFAAKHNIQIEGGFEKGAAIMAIVEEFCEKHFVQPTILYDYPIETSSLAKPKRDNPRYAERFEHYINCFEVGNHYSELNDPNVLVENWKKQEEALKKGQAEAQRMDEDFINALKVGMPPACGIGIGVDRMVMLLTDQTSIRDVIFFPFMRPKTEEKKLESEIPNSRNEVSRKAKK